MQQDPLGVLAPALISLLLAMVSSWGAAAIWGTRPLLALALFALAPTWLGIPCRGLMVARAAALEGHHLSVPRWVAAEALVQLAVTAALIAGVAPGVLGASWLATHRYVSLAGVLFGLGCLAGLLAGWLVRGLLGMTPHHIALRASWREGLEEGRNSWPIISLTWLGGVLAFFAGTCVFGIGGLVTYPVADLALLHRRLSRGDAS